jgi:hypothetical protein
MSQFVGGVVGTYLVEQHNSKAVTELLGWTHDRSQSERKNNCSSCVQTGHLSI